MGRNDRWKPLSPGHKRYLCDEIARQLSVARQGSRTAWARKIVDTYLWFWSADGEDERGNVGRDKLKYSFDFLWHSEAACGLSRAACASGQPPKPAGDPRHEHAVPKKLIMDRLLRSPGIDAKEVMAVLEQHCRAVILTNEEDKKLNKFFQNSMPHPWDIDNPKADPLARYKHQSVGLGRTLHPPRSNGSPHTSPSVQANRRTKRLEGTVKAIRHRWSDEDINDAIDICLDHPPGEERERAGQELVQKMNADPSNPISPPAIGQALKATANAIEGTYDVKPRASKALIRIVEERRRKGTLRKKWST